MAFISPKQFARSASVSESTVKRWCDQGLIPVVKTAGGHRRLPLAAATEFLRQSQVEFKPELLSLPVRTGVGTRTDRNLLDDFYQALIAGQTEACRQILFDLYYTRKGISQICDRTIASAMHRAGSAWECGELHIYQERRAAAICWRLLEELKAVVPASKRDAPAAIGGTPSGDPYMLPTAMVEIVLRQAGWRAQSLGSGLPFPTLLAAVKDLQPDLCWISVSHIADEREFVADYQQWRSQLSADLPIVVGGRALTEDLRRQLDFTAYCDNMQQLEALTKVLKKASLTAKKTKRQRSSPAKRNVET